MNPRGAFLGLALLATALVATIALELDAGTPQEDQTGIVAIHHPPLPQARAEAEDPVDHTDEWVGSILARPLFSRDRRPTPVLAKGGGESMLASLPRLTGVMVGPFGRSAIFAGPDGGKPLVVTEGATLGPYTVQSIAPGHVVIAGPEGVREVVPAYDEAARRALVAETQQLQQQQQQQQQQLLQVPGRPNVLNLRPGSQFQRALQAIDASRPQQPQSADQ